MDDSVILRDEAQTGQDTVGDLTIDWAVVCHVGRVREANEDDLDAL
ncbi:MAG: serine/threonine-protein phosphatase, partial [Gordonia sp. (in: high G+C Gram-positive bacteria)]|nr:serine/threonine-protein phosphatase [Gordonia sp. (in: high G+C Gram-positive bacteria)]